MAIYKGDVKVSGNAMMVALPMFFATYQPRKLNNPSWLRAEPYSWHSADTYVSAYAHLADNISGVTAETETIAGTTITYYRLSDEIKVVLPDQETNLDTIYNATGIGYYFVLDTTNRQFKLPRNIYGFTGYRGDVGGYVEESLPNINAQFGGVSNGTDSGAVTSTQLGAFSGASSGGGPAQKTFNASLSSSTYQNNAPVQERATQAYLYFYVGNTVQNETSVDAGQIMEDLNGKADLDLSNVTNTGKSTAAGWAMPSDVYEDLTLGVTGDYYAAPSNGYLVIDKQSNGANQYIEFISHLQVGVFIPQSGYHGRLSLPVIEGEQIRVLYNAGGTTQMFRFYYAEGSKSEQ